MRKPLLLVSLVVVLAVLACTAEQQKMLEQFVDEAQQDASDATQSVAVAQADITETPGISELVLPTAEPTMAGPMGTLTAIAELVASPIPDRTPYEIVLSGNPHFIEFHAWW